MAAPNRWAIQDAGEASFFDLTTGKPIVTLRTLKTSGVETTGETVYAEGGRGNARLVGFSSNRRARITLQDAIFDNNALAMLTGNDLVVGAKNITRNEYVTISTNTGTLQKTPVGNLLGVYKLNADGTKGQELTKKAGASLATGEYDVTGKNISTFAGDISNGTKLLVYYVVATDITAKSAKVTSDKFGKSFKVTLDVLCVDEFTKQAYQGQLIIPNAKFEDNFNLSFAASGDPAVLDLNMEILKSPTSTDMWELVIFDDALLT